MIKLILARRARKAAEKAAAEYYETYLTDLYEKVAAWHNSGLPPELA